MLINNKFNANKASLKGGAIYTECGIEEDCTLQINDKNVFSNNYAGEQGGAIYWSDIEPKFNLSKLTLLNN